MKLTYTTYATYLSVILLTGMLLIGGCSGVTVEKNQYMTVEEGAFPKLSTVNTADGTDTPTAKSAKDQAAAAGLLSQNGNWTSTTDAETEIQQQLRAAVEAVLTGQGKAEGGTAETGDNSDGSQ